MLTRLHPGVLQSVDSFMHVALEQTREIVEGKVRRNYGDVFIRGNNGTSARCVSSLDPSHTLAWDVHWLIWCP